MTIHNIGLIGFRKILRFITEPGQCISPDIGSSAINFMDGLIPSQELESRKAEIKSAELALDGVREEARMGQRTTLDILDAERELTEAKILLAQAMRNEVVAEYTLAARVGLLRRHISNNQISSQ